MWHFIERYPTLRRYLKAALRIGPLALADALVLVFAYSLTYSVRTGSLLFVTHHVAYFVLSAVLISFLALYVGGAYRRIWSHTSGHDVSIIMVPTIVATALVLVLNLLLSPRPLPVSVVIVRQFKIVKGALLHQVVGEMRTGAGSRPTPQPAPQREGSQKTQLQK